jgi:hypothetical protein
MIERFGTLRRYVQENLRVFVDVSELAQGGEGRSVRVRWTWRQPWRATRIANEKPAHEELDVELLSDAEILLEPRANSTARAASAPARAQ